jgi:hypothetical protein
MKYFKKLKLYKASNVVFNPETKRATSYGHWLFLGHVNGMLVFNDHAYSTTTMRHQRLVKGVLSDLGIKPDLVIDSRQSLSTEALQDAIQRLGNENASLLETMAMPRTHKKKNAERMKIISDNKKQIAKIYAVLNK